MAPPAAPPAPFAFRPARRRLPAQHPFLEDGDVWRGLSLFVSRQQPPPQEDAEQERSSSSSSASAAASSPPAVWCPWGGCGQTFGSLQSAEHHYELLHRHACAACRRAFPSPHLLHLHLLERHDALFQLTALKHSMYQCLVESCAEKFKSSRDRKDHLIRVHRYPSDFRFGKPAKSKSTKTTSLPSSRDHPVPMDVNTEACEHPPADAMETGLSETVMDQALLPGTGNTSVTPLSETRRSTPRIPPSICFGQGATRGFKSRKKRA